MDQKDFNRRLMPARPKMYRMALMLLKSREDAEDALQEVYLRLWTKRFELNDIRNHEAYAMTMTKNQCLDRLRSQKNKQTETISDMEPDAATMTPFMNTSFKNLKDLMTRLIETLPEQQRLVMYMRDIEQYSYNEIEDITGMAMGNIRSNLSRARKSVRQNYLKIKAYESR